MSGTDTVNSLVSKLQTAMDATRQQIADTRQRLAELISDRERIQMAPACIEEVRDRIRRTVAEHGVGWLQRHGHSFFIMDGSRVGLAGPPSEHGDTVHLSDMEDAWGWMCAAEPERAASILETLLKRTGQYHPGLAKTEREAAIQLLQAEIEDLEHGEERAIDEAAAAGVSIEHRPEVTQRRQREARALQMRDAAAQIERDRNNDVSRQYGSESSGRRFARSPYLETDPQSNG